MDYASRCFGRLSRGPWRYCFNVKLGRLDLSTPNLITRCQDMGCPDAVHPDSPWWQDQAQLIRARISTEDLCQFAIEDAQRTYIGRTTDDHEDYPDDDAFNTLWDGRSVDTRFFFAGRSGGWLVFAGFQGHTLDRDLALEHLDTATLTDLAEMVWFVHRSLAHKERTIEEYAAFNFFYNLAQLPNPADLCGIDI